MNLEQRIQILLGMKDFNIIQLQVQLVDAQAEIARLKELIGMPPMEPPKSE